MIDFVFTRKQIEILPRITIIWNDDFIIAFEWLFWGIYYQNIN